MDLSWNFASNYFHFFLNIISKKGSFIKGRFDIPTTQMFIFIVFVTAGILFEGAFTFPVSLIRSSHPKVFLRKGVLKICSKFTGEHPCLSVISINLQSNFIEIALRHGCSPVNLLHIFRKPFPTNTSEWLLLLYLLVVNHFCKEALL